MLGGVFIPGPSRRSALACCHQSAVFSAVEATSGSGPPPGPQHSTLLPPPPAQVSGLYTVQVWGAPVTAQARQPTPFQRRFHRGGSGEQGAYGARRAAQNEMARGAPRRVGAATCQGRATVLHVRVSSAACCRQSGARWVVSCRAVSLAGRYRGAITSFWWVACSPNRSRISAPFPVPSPIRELAAAGGREEKGPGRGAWVCPQLASRPGSPSLRRDARHAGFPASQAAAPPKQSCCTWSNLPLPCTPSPTAHPSPSNPEDPRTTDKRPPFLAAMPANSCSFSALMALLKRVDSLWPRFRAARLGVMASLPDEHGEGWWGGVGREVHTAGTREGGPQLSCLGAPENSAENQAVWYGCTRWEGRGGARHRRYGTAEPGAGQGMHACRSSGCHAAIPGSPVGHGSRHEPPMQRPAPFLVAP